MKANTIAEILACLRPVEDRLLAMEGMIILLQNMSVSWDPPAEIHGEKTSVCATASDAMKALKDSFQTAWEQIAALKKQ